MAANDYSPDRSWKTRPRILAASSSLLIAGILGIVFWPASGADPTVTLDAAITTTNSHSTTTYAPVEDQEGAYEPLRSCAIGDPTDPCGSLEDGSTFDPQWQASVTLGCGKTPDTRTVLTFEPETNHRGTASLMWSEPSGRTFQLEVGSELPSSGRLGWALHGYYLGPWDVDEVDDTCVSS